MWLIQSDTSNEWNNAQDWQIDMIETTIRTKENYYDINQVNPGGKVYIYICIHNTPGQIFLWNLTTDKMRIVIHSAYGIPNHTGPVNGGGTSVDYLDSAPREFQKYREPRTRWS